MIMTQSKLTKKIMMSEDNTESHSSGPLGLMWDGLDLYGSMMAWFLVGNAHMKKD